MLKITDIKAIPFRIPYGKKLSWATGSATAADHVLVIITTSEGINGYAEAIPRSTIYGESQKSVITAIKDWFTPILINQSPFSINFFEEELNKFPANNTAKAAINMALYDIQAKYANIPLYQFLGGENKKIPLSWMVHLDTKDNMVKQVQEKYELGYKYFKIKGGNDPSTDIELIKLIRSEIGDEVHLYIDANQGYSIDSFARVVYELKSLGITMIEEPLPVSFKVRSKMKTRLISANSEAVILGDESVFTSSQVLDEFLQDNIDLVSLKPARTGVTESKRIMNLCWQFGKGALIGTQGETAIGTLLSAHIALGLNVVNFPAELSFFTIFNEQITRNLPDVRDGFLIVPEMPGSGIEINEKVLKKFRLD